MRAIISHNPTASHGIVHRGTFAGTFVSTAVLAAAFCGTPMLAAQAPTTAAPIPAAHRPTHPHKRTTATKKKVDAPQPIPVPVTPPAPEIPHWPANEAPVHATVTWDSQGLRISAANSSLQQILNDVATATGAKLQGLDTDERIYGAFGPGTARDVLSQLLHGSGYNILMIGDQGQGTPRQIVLTSRNGATTTNQPAANPVEPDEDTDPDEQPQPQPQPPPQPPIRPGFQPGGQRTPPDNMQQRQQQIQQQRQQQGQPQPPNNPPN